MFTSITFRSDEYCLAIHGYLYLHIPLTLPEGLLSRSGSISPSKQLESTVAIWGWGLHLTIYPFGLVTAVFAGRPPRCSPLSSTLGIDSTTFETEL
jgi:hypothetical protein